MNVINEFLITLCLGAGAGLFTYIVLALILRTTPQVVEHWSGAARARIVDFLFVILVGIFVSVFSILVTLRLSAFASSIDLAQYDQLVWNSLRGRLLENTFVPDAPLFLGKSFVPILLAFVPLYVVWSSPLVLSIAQVVAFAAGAFPIYWFARKQVGHILAFAIAFAYLLSPVVVNSIVIEFHEIALATPLLAYAAFFLLRRNYRACCATLAIALLVKEELAFVTVGFGVYIFLFQRKRGLGLALALVGLVWGALLLYYVIPFYQGASPGKFYYFSGGWIAGGASRYGYLGSDLSEIARTLLTRPDIVLQHLLVREKIEFVLHLLIPLLFLPLLGADVAMLALPTLAYTLLSDYRWQYSIQTYYPAPLVPFLFFAAAIGLARLLRRAGARVALGTPQGALAAMLLTVSIVTYLLHTTGPLARGFSPNDYVVTAHTRLGRSLTRTIPSDAAVVAQNEFLAHLSHRRFVYEIPLIPDYRLADWVFADRTREWYDIHRGFWDTFLSSGYFEIVTQQDGYLVAKRREPDQPSRITFGGQATLLGYTIIPTETLRGGMVLRPVVLWQAEQAIAERYRIALRVEDARGHTWAEENREPQAGHMPTTRWETGKPVGDQYSLRLPHTMPAGEYQLTVAVYASANDALEARDRQGNLLGTDAVIGTLRIERDKSSITASQLSIEQPLFVDMREMRFLGYVPPREKIRPGELLPVGVYWRARGKPQGDYVVAVQLRDATGRVVFEQASRPANGTYPTTEWDAGEVLLDWHDFTLPRDLAPGKYVIHLVLREGARALGETDLSTIVLTSD